MRYVRLFVVLVIAGMVLPGLGPLAQIADGYGVWSVGMVGHGVWVDDESAEPFVLMVWVEDGDVYFSSTFKDQYRVVLEDVLVAVVDRYEASRGGVRARYALAIGHLEAALASEDPATCVDTLSKTVVLLSTLGEDGVVQDIVSLVREQAWLGLLYNENKTQEEDGDVGKALHHYNQALSHMEYGRQVAAMQSFAAAFKQMPYPILGWDKVTRLSYTGECRTPLVYWAYDEAYDQFMLHAGWITTVEEENHTVYARSTNQGRTWWTLDATLYGTPYLTAYGLDPYEGNPLAAMTAVRLLEKIYVIDGSHYFYVPFPTPPILPPTNPPFTGELGDTIYGSIDDPTFDKYTEYTWITIGGRHFIKPICRPGKIPLPPPKMADLIVVDFVTLPGTVLEGKPAIVEVEVKNIGTGGISGTISISLGNNGNFVVENFTTSLSEGEVKTFSFSEFYVYERPLLSVEVFANTQEGDTENNRLEKDVFITYEHDLAVVSVKPSATLCVSQQGVLDVMVENRGHEKISSVLFYVFSHTFDMLVPFDFVLPLLPGSSRVLQVDIPSFEESGLFDIHVMGFIVDASPEIYSAHDNLGSTTVPVYEVVSSPWIVTGEEEYYGKAFLVKNGLTVENGGNLSLLDCTITFSSTISKLFVKQGGEMSLYVSQVSSTPGTISGFVVEGSIVMEYSAVSNIMGGVDIRSPLNRINYSEIYECSPQAIIVSDNPVFVTNSVIRDSPIGVKMANSLGSMFERCTIYNNDIGVDAFASQTYLDKCNVQNTMNIRADDKIAAQTTISLVDTPVPWTSVLLSGSSQIVAHRNMFVQIHESDGSLSLVDHTLTINGGPVKDSDDGNLDGVYANLLVTQWRRN
ncbi:MAG: hypothetical protein QCI38_01480, partial [Candidatus Thermoplasmatota archaeon]|nr:hypothetical protein [Candidatus Thermoplasmatota archaeon]